MHAQNVFLKNLDNVEGSLYKIAENEKIKGNEAMKSNVFE
jgi:hypothetical protein